MKIYPAIDIATAADPDLILAAVDGFAPTAAEERGTTLRIFFPSPSARDEAYAALGARRDVSSVDVPDEDWARRSQENLQPVTVGRITIAPPWAGLKACATKDPCSNFSLKPIVVVIQPSMGFGTGHHATTRLCLAAMQAPELSARSVSEKGNHAPSRDALKDAFVLDVGTGSGVLAIAAGLLGAARTVGIDNDPDAIQSARENLPLNPGAVRVEFLEGDLTARDLPRADVVTANLTGAMLVTAAPVLLAAVRAGGTLILSGLLTQERDDVCLAFAPTAVVWEREEDGWVCLMLRY